MAKKKSKKKEEVVVDPRIELLGNIQSEITTFENNANDYMEGNKAAGTRSRKASLNLTKLFKEWRSITVHS